MSPQGIVFVRWSWFCDDVIDCMRDLGHEVWVVERNQKNLPDVISGVIAAKHPKLLFSLNFNPLFAEIAPRNHLQSYVAWNIDNLVSSAFCRPEHAYPETKLYCIDRPSIDIYRHNGYADVHYLPIGTRLDRFAAEDGPQGYLHDVSFVGCSMIRKGNEFPGILARFEQAVCDAQTDADRQGNQLVVDALKLIVAEGIKDPFAVNVKAVIEQLNKKLGFDLAEVIWNDPVFFHIIPAKEISARKRIALIKSACEAGPVDVYGDPEWGQVECEGLTYHGEADYRTVTASVYRRSMINLNIEKVYNTSSINLRMIDAMAAGGFVLTERVDDLAGYFVDGRDYVSYCSVQDMQEKIRYYLIHEEERERIASNGCQVVKRDFSLHSRVEAMLSVNDGG